MEGLVGYTIVLIYADSFTIKKYIRTKAVVDGTGQNISVTFVALNPDYSPLLFDIESEDKPNVVGTFRKVIPFWLRLMPLSLFHPAETIPEPLFEYWISDVYAVTV